MKLPTNNAKQATTTANASSLVSDISVDVGSVASVAASQQHNAQLKDSSDTPDLSISNGVFKNWGLSGCEISTCIAMNILLAIGVAALLVVIVFVFVIYVRKFRVDRSASYPFRRNVSKTSNSTGSVITESTLSGTAPRSTGNSFLLTDAKSKSASSNLTDSNNNSKNHSQSIEFPPDSSSNSRLPTNLREGITKL